MIFEISSMTKKSCTTDWKYSIRFDENTIILTPTGINKNKKGEILETNVLNDRKLLKSVLF